MWYLSRIEFLLKGLFTAWGGAKCAVSTQETA